ncbi:RNA polymerase factor sigma-54 [Lysobacter sp. Root983]|uniref:RNA polymerase factor sigma-54 n=1 Tax=Lysobacter sp. Root983 TaxID=1736613 RepID=UPI0007090195|nr:RNA polymerase factor sigma-54 [Lysobacter sp. Root983]KRD78113.1 RNA polymerase sigma-54 factor [Lysobacter sp. Root983]
MKPRLQASLGQQLVMTPQLRQAIRLLQLSAVELEAELVTAVESNPLLDWTETAISVSNGADGGSVGDERESAPESSGEDHRDALPPEADWGTSDGEPWYQRIGPSDQDDDGPVAEQVADADTLHDHLLWQLHLSPLTARDRLIGVSLIEAIDDDGYLREPLDAIAASLGPAIDAGVDELTTVLHQIQRYDPVGVGARSLGECLRLQLSQLPVETPGRELANSLANGPLERLPKVGVAGLAAELKLEVAEVETAVQLLRSLDPRPGAQIGAIAADTYVAPDVVIWRQHGLWRVALADGMRPRVSIHRGYEGMIRHASAADASYLRGHLQEARWLLKSLEARGDTLLKVTRCLLKQQAAFLEFGDSALRPLTLREVANEIGLHESTVSRAISRKYARTPRGTVPLRAFFASGIDTGSGGEASSTAIQAMIRRLIEAENPRKPLSDARLAETLKATGVPVARRTVAKYREAMSIPSSQDRVRMA